MAGNLPQKDHRPPQPAVEHRRARLGVVVPAARAL